MENPPVLVIGAHRSGTSLVARLLDEAGVFMGRDLEENHESRFFIGLNEWVFQNAGATWDRPGPVADLLTHTEAADAVTDYLDRSVRSVRARRYWGVRRAGRGAWGFKDPRSTATLPLWLRLWPDAKVVHVKRHGVDVAMSLHARQQRVWPQRRSSYKRSRWSYRWRASRHPVATSTRTTDLEGAFRVWEDYMVAAERNLTGIDALEVRYEDLLQHSETTWTGIASYLGLGDVPHHGLGRIRPERALAHEDHPEGQRLAARHHGLLSAWRDLDR